MSDEYRLIGLALPHFEELQKQTADAVADYNAGPKVPVLNVVDIGCGNGVTAHAILQMRGDIHLKCLDNEAEMVRQAKVNLESALAEEKCEVLHADALSFFQEQPEESVHIAASVLTLHNLERGYRNLLQQEIFRVLVPGGAFINADKYAPQDDIQRFKALGTALERFFEAYAPLGKIDLLKDWVLHNVADQAPDRCMKEADTVDILRSIGFVNINVTHRNNMEALLTASKPGY